MSVFDNNKQELERVESEVNVEEIVLDLKKQGLNSEQIIKALKKLVEEKKITEEDYNKALKLLEAHEREEASKLLGVDLTK